MSFFCLPRANIAITSHICNIDTIGVENPEGSEFLGAHTLHKRAINVIL